MLGARPQEAPGKRARKGMQIEQQATSQKTLIRNSYIPLSNTHQFIVTNCTIFPQMGLKVLKTVLLDEDTRVKDNSLIHQMLQI